MQLKWTIILFVGFFFVPVIASSVFAAPVSPQGPHYWCLSGQASVRLNWFPVAGATSYQVRVDADAPSWNGSCITPDSCLSTPTNEITIPITPGKTYDWWVHAVNADGWSQPAMAGVEFNCTIPVPAGLHYQCKPDNTAILNWYDTNLAHLYDVYVDEGPPSWNGRCSAPDKCMSVTENTATIAINQHSEYEFWVQSKDTKGNKSAKSEALTIRCNSHPSPTTIPPSPITPSAEPTSLPTPTPTIIQSIPTDQPVTPRPDCPRRTEGDANCDGNVNIADSFCWEKVYAINFLSTSNGCRYTNFDETDGTNILDYAIWYVNWEL